MKNQSQLDVLRQRQASAQERLLDAVSSGKDVGEINARVDEIDALNRAAAALPSPPERKTTLKLVAVGCLVLASAALSLAIRISPGRVTVDAVVTNFDMRIATNGKEIGTPKLASSIQIVPGSLKASGAKIDRRLATASDDAELAKMTNVTELTPYSLSSRVRISTSKAKCYEFAILEGEWRATASRFEKAIAATSEIAVLANSELSFCTPEGLTLSIFGVTWLAIHRPFADMVPPFFAPSIASGTLQRERVAGDRKLAEGERIELNQIRSSALELRNHDRLKLSFAGNADQVCSLRGVGTALNGTCDDDLRPTLFDLFRENPLLAQILVAIAGVVGFSGTIARFFGWKIPGLAVLVITIMPHPSLVAPAAAQDARPIILNNLVRLTARNTDGTVSEGYGLVIGRKDDDIWIVTAAHVVFLEQRVPFQASSITAVIGPPECQTAAPASEAPYKPGRTDIALLPLRVPLRIQGQAPVQGMPPQASACELWIPSVLSEGPVAGEELKLIGHSGRLEINPRVVRLTGGAAPQGPFGSVGIEGLSSQGGDSGAPVASARGVVGLYIGAVGAAGYMVPINVIREAISGSDSPWQLTAGSDPTPGIVRFCVQQTGPERPEIRLQGPTDAIALDASGCATAPRATLRVNVPNPALHACEPSRIAPTKDNQTILIACSAKLDGYWRHGATDGLTVSTLSPGRWRISGLATTPFGPLSGEVRGTSSDANGLIVSALDSSVHLSVTLTGATKSLKVLIQGPSGERTVELTR
jgi:hypothetical protein